MHKFAVRGRLSRRHAYSCGGGSSLEPAGAGALSIAGASRGSHLDRRVVCKGQERVASAARARAVLRGVRVRGLREAHQCVPPAWTEHTGTQLGRHELRHLVA